MPRWVKLFVLLGLVLLLLVVALLLAVGHGPGDHAPGMLVGLVGGGSRRVVSRSGDQAWLREPTRRKTEDGRG